MIDAPRDRETPPTTTARSTCYPPTRARDVPTTGVQQVARDAVVVATALRGVHTIAIEIPPAKPARNPAKYGALGARRPHPRAYARVRAQTAAGRQVPCALPTSRSYPPAWVLGQLR